MQNPPTIFATQALLQYSAVIDPLPSTPSVQFGGLNRTAAAWTPLKGSGPSSPTVLYVEVFSLEGT